jgi:hypothetical protein
MLKWGSVGWPDAVGRDGGAARLGGVGEK